MAPKVKDIKMGQLTTAVKELNELLFEPGDKNRIKTVGVSKGVLVSKLKEATAALDPAEGDKVTQATAATLQLLEIEIPEGVPVIGVEEEKEEEKKEEEPKKAQQKKATKGSKDKSATKEKVKKDKKAKYTRVQAFCDSLAQCTAKKPKSIDEIAQEMKHLYSKNNTEKKQAKLVSTIWSVTDYIAPMLLLGFVKKTEEGKYYLDKNGN